MVPTDVFLPHSRPALVSLGFRILMLLILRWEEGHWEAPAALGKHRALLRVRRNSRSCTGSGVSQSHFDLGQKARSSVALVPLPTAEIQTSSP